MGNYRLTDDGEPVLELNVLTLARWFETTDRRVAETQLDGCRISTVFLGIDHDVTGEGPPVLWETLIFGGEHDGAGNRYSSFAAAVAGHELYVMVVRGETTPEAIQEVEDLLKEGE